MKKIVTIAISLTMLVACSKMENNNPFSKKEKHNSCAVVGSDVISANVLTAFQAKYPNATVDKWFNKDNTGFCALFTISGNKTLAQFNNDGSFVKEESNLEQDGNHQNNDESGGCECELEGGD